MADVAIAKRALERSSARMLKRGASILVAAMTLAFVEASASAQSGPAAPADTTTPPGAPPPEEAPASAATPPVTGGPGESCRARTDCNDGLKCVSNMCSDEREGATCSSRADCGGQLACIDKTCVVPGSPGSAPAGNGSDDAGRREPLWEIFAAGTVMWGTAYLAGIIATAVVTSETGGDVGLATGVAAIPVVGPWIGFPVTAATDGNLTGAMIGGIVAVGVIQGVGFTMMMVGSTVTRPVQTQAASTFHIIPTFDPKHGMGAAAFGTF